jgi:two-component system, sensor histidine kinase PdtaS
LKQNSKSRALGWFASLATGTKMIIILGLALLPLGVIAVLASLNAARTNRASDLVEAQSVLALATQRLASRFTEAGVTIRVAAGAVAGATPEAAARACDRAAVQLGDGGAPVRFAIFGGGQQPVCRTQGYEPASPALLPPMNALAQAQVDPSRGHVTVVLLDPRAGTLGQIEFPVALLSAIAHPGRPPLPVELALSGKGGTVTLFDSLEGGDPSREVTSSSDLLGGRLQLSLRAATKPLTAGEVIMILLPVLMWLFAAIIGWLVVHRLLLRPLAAMQRAILAYEPGERGFEPPASRSPAREINDLGEAFEEVTRTVARHEAELEAAVERQTRLVREVHHRVKNNLQVVASLLNIHSRSSTSDEVAAAYASIQRRVDALAVVHRNHYAELEKTPGVALRALIAELGASLRASAPSGASKLQIRLALEPLYSNQDVAVSVAFLITETVEFAMLCGCGLVSISLEEEEQPGRARLSIESDALNGSASCSPEVRERFERIIAGLARQLRSTPERVPEEGRFSVSIAVLGQEAA